MNTSWEKQKGELSQLNVFNSVHFSFPEYIMAMATDYGIWPLLKGDLSPSEKNGPIVHKQKNSPPPRLTFL